MSEKAEIKTEMNGFGALAILFLFFMFWSQSGWYRIDCAMHVQRACDLIAAEYVGSKRP